MQPKAWSQAWPDEPFNMQDKRAKLISELLHYLNSTAAWDRFLGSACQQLDGSCIVPIPYLEFKTACNDSSSLEMAFVHEPLTALKCLAVACHEALVTSHKSKFTLRHRDKLPLPLVRLSGFGEETPFRQIKGSIIGKIVVVRGTVVRMGASHPLATLMDFACLKCGQKNRLDLPDGKFNFPQSCTGKGCRSKGFTPIRSSAKCTDWRTARIQEIVGVSKQQAGQVSDS